MLKRKNIINWEAFLDNDKEALRMLDDLGFVDRHVCCPGFGYHIVDYKQKWYVACGKGACIKK